MGPAETSRARRPGRGEPCRHVWALAAIGASALLVRAAVVLVTRHSYLLINDAADYNRLGASLARGHGFGTSHFAPGGGPTAVRPPGFPLLLGGLYSTVGVHVTAARLAGAVLGAGAAVLIATIVHQVSGDRRHVLAAGFLAAVFPPMVIASTTVMSEVLFVPLSLAMITCALAYRRRGEVRWLTLAGLLLGLATLTRPVGAVLALPVALIARSGRPAVSGRAAAGLLAAFLMLAPCAAWETRDVLVLHHVVPLTTQGGYLLAGTYNATSASSRSQPGAWIVATEDPAIAHLVANEPNADEVRLGKVLTDAATSYLREHPTYLFTVLGHNFLRLFDLTDASFARAVIHGEYGYGSIAAMTEYASALAVLAFALLALAFGGGRGWPAALWLVPLLMIAATVPVQSFSRFRAPIDPYLVVLAASLLATRPRRPEGGRSRPPSMRSPSSRLR